MITGGIGVQLNVYVPKDKEDLLIKLDTVSKNLGRPKNDVVIEALERYLRVAGRRIEFGKYPGRVIGSLSRRDIYEDR